eukprot:3812133-Amphidinium_carterae.2
MGWPRHGCMHASSIGHELREGMAPVSHVCCNPKKRQHGREPSMCWGGVAQYSEREWQQVRAAPRVTGHRPDGGVCLLGHSRQSAI